MFVFIWKLFLFVGFTELMVEGEGIDDADDNFCFSLLVTKGSCALIALATGEPLAAAIGVRRVKKFIRFCVL